MSRITVAGEPATAATYKGRRRDGTAVVGRLACADVSSFVRNSFRRGWQWLTVRAVHGEIGGIGPHPDDGHRTWWADPGVLAAPREPGSGPGRRR